MTNITKNTNKAEYWLEIFKEPNIFVQKIFFCCKFQNISLWSMTAFFPRQFYYKFNNRASSARCHGWQAGRSKATQPVFLPLPLIQLSEAGSSLHFKSSYQTPLSTNTSIFSSSTVCDRFSSSSLDAEV